VSLTVVIAASEHLAALQKQADSTNAQAFADTDVLKALEFISQARPQLIALHPTFAASARGTALVNRIKADPALASCEIRVLETETPGAAEPAPSPASAPVQSAAIAAVEAPRVADAGMDLTAAASNVRLEGGTRRAQRYVISGNVDVLVDGNPAALVNISIVGAQVVSPSSLRPNQRVRMSLVDEARPIRFNGVVAWATFEMPKEGPRYRAGINFYDAAPEMVTRFIESITTT
jgi:hypothetical protein